MGGHRKRKNDYIEVQREGNRKDGLRRKSYDNHPSFLVSALEMLFIILLSLSISLTLKTFLFETFNIPSGSMEKTLQIKDRIVVNKLSMWLNHNPKAGDIIVFQDPGGWLSKNEIQDNTNQREPFKSFQKFLIFLGIVPNTQNGFLVKRIIGVGGDRVQCCDINNKLLLNGKPLEEKYISLPPYADKQHTPHAPTTFNVKIPEHYVWVMGDNRYDSCDSLCHIGDISHGFVPESDIVGKVVYIIWPLNHLKKL